MEYSSDYGHDDPTKEVRPGDFMAMNAEAARAYLIKKVGEAAQRAAEERFTKWLDAGEVVCVSPLKITAKIQLNLNVHIELTDDGIVLDANHAPET